MISRVIPMLVSILLALLWGSLGPLAQTPVDLQQMKNDLQIFEAILDQTLDQVFANPFALVEGAKGVYLSGFGATFTFSINIKTATMATPFGTITRSEASDPKLREQKIDELRERIVSVLGSYGNAINQLRDTDTVAVVSHIADQNFGKKAQNKTIIVRVQKKEMTAFASRQIALADFKKRVQILEY